jgi:hypothetical protein
VVLFEFGVIVMKIGKIVVPCHSGESRNAVANYGLDSESSSE